MRRLRSTLLVPILGLALVAPGCGSGDADVEEVPGPPAELNVPHQRGAGDLSEGADATPTPTSTATPAPAETGETGGTGGTGTTGSTGETAPAAAATPAPAAEDGPATDQEPATGSPPEQFEQFCQENAGAC